MPQGGGCRFPGFPDNPEPHPETGLSCRQRIGVSLLSTLCFAHAAASMKPVHDSTLAIIAVPGVDKPSGLDMDVNGWTLAELAEKLGIPNRLIT
jgi:hypothetical protein